jgi:hypothetical protein
MLLVLLLIKHGFADWRPFQTTWMIRGKRRKGLSFIVPLTAHSGVHAVFTVIAVAFWYASRNEFGQYKLCLLAGTFDFFLHFVIDRGKALLEQVSNNRKYRVILLITDQICHVMTYFVIMLFLNSR